MPEIEEKTDSVRSSRAGHTFHERWAARRALQLVFPHDDLFAIAVEGLSTTETAKPGEEAADVADLVLYYGAGEKFETCNRLETIQFKYKDKDAPVTASYLKKTLGKFCDTLIGYEGEFAREVIDAKVSFAFVTNADFSPGLWAAVKALKAGVEIKAEELGAEEQTYLAAICKSHKVADPKRLFERTEFRAAEKSLPAQSNLLHRTLTDWSAGTDSTARLRLLGMQELVLRKAGPSGQKNNLIKREDVLDALDCDPDELYPADTRFIDVGAVVERSELGPVGELVERSTQPVFVHAEGGVGKTVFIQSLAARLSEKFEVVVFDCFGGGAYRSDDQARHLPKIGLIQIANELAARGLCDPLLPGDSDRIGLIKAGRKRFTQAAKAIREQSTKQGILLIIDAADNAQVEADHRREDAFPKLLLSSLDGSPIDGVKLLMTARTHRLADVVAKSSVAPFELGPFTEPEAKEFLKARRPDAPSIEIKTALKRSGGNARVLDYLVQTWDLNVIGNEESKPITVPEIIGQRCRKIIGDLETAGWKHEEVREFFVALSLLPTPIPLDELAGALGWSKSQVATAASDLAPMLELETHGAIFRDEPTETYIRETYATEVLAQQAIAQRLLTAQSSSAYAAEALPHFLVVIKDSDRAFALADSQQFPSSIQSDFGRRRLILARLRAAFRLAVTARDLDRVLNLTVKLAQVASANLRGDEFIRRAPALATMLGDPDAYRRLFNDRAGWRGARHSRLTIAHSFAGAIDEGFIQRESSIRWMKWNAEQHRDEVAGDKEGPDVSDFAAVLFQDAVEGRFNVVDHNLARWNRTFSLSTARQVLTLLTQYSKFSGVDALSPFIKFAIGKDSQSYALKVAILSRQNGLAQRDAQALARSAGAAAQSEEQEKPTFRYERKASGQSDILYAALTALVTGSKRHAGRILSTSSASRPSAQDYSDRYGQSQVWSPTLRACLGAWVKGRSVSYPDLLPSEVKITRKARAIAGTKELSAFLQALRNPKPAQEQGKARKREKGPQFGEREREEIADGIALILSLAGPVEMALLSKRPIASVDVAGFLDAWQQHLRTDVYRRHEGPLDLLSRTVGIGFARILLRHAEEVDEVQARRLVSLISNERFGVSQKIIILAHLAQRPNLHQLAGTFARFIADEIGKDDYVEQRGQSYSDLAAALVGMSLDEAREYYRQGLSQLDQMGGEDFEQIYSLMHFAAEQRGGNVRPELAQRMMNLCQSIMQGEPSKFGWVLFAKAAASSIGFPAAYKLLRWDDQDVANFSYGLPQLACFLAAKRALDPRRAAFLLLICEDHGWHEWQVGDGVLSLLDAATPKDREPIFQAVLAKLKLEHDAGGWPSIWGSILAIADKYPEVFSKEDQAALYERRVEAEARRDEENAKNNPPRTSHDIGPPDPSVADAEKLVDELVAGCDPTSALAIDEALGRIEDEKALPYYAQKNFLVGLRDRCGYDQQLPFLLALCEAARLEFDRTLNFVLESLEVWGPASASLVASRKRLIERLFEFKGSGLFDDRYSHINRHISRLTEFCGDRGYVLDRVLHTISLEQIDLDGDEWLQLATSLCKETSPEAELKALETLLSGPSSRIADQIGEGGYRPGFSAPSDEAALLTDLIWHLLGDDDAYMRWSVARGLGSLLELGLEDTFDLLLDRFDQDSVGPLESPNVRLSFQNSQQWLLIALARATLKHPTKLGHLRQRLVDLAQRPDVHVVNRQFIVRSLENLLRGETLPDPALLALKRSIEVPPHGYQERQTWPGAVEGRQKFRFDYEFGKTEIAGLARTFGLTSNAAADAIGEEISKRWPYANDLDYFPGTNRYRHDRNDRHEFYREHIQRHALLSAATTLVGSLPVSKSSYDGDDSDAWRDWRKDYDTTFDDGSWLADHKDPMPAAAKVFLLGRREGRQETLKEQQFLLDTVQVTRTDRAAVLLYADWTTPDGVSVDVVSALSDRKGAVARCEAFSKRTGHDFWVPQFWDDGHFRRQHHQPNPFDPLVWSPPNYGLGIDGGDEIAAQGPANRPRLGK